MRQKAFATALLLALLLAAGCTDRIDYRLPANPQAFIGSDFVNPDNPDDAYLSFTYNGRTYIPYGALQGRLTGKDVGPCLGYLLSGEVKDDHTRVFGLRADPDGHWMAIISRDGFMEQPSFWRAVDTVGQDIPVPEFIISLHYDFWE